MAQVLCNKHDATCLQICKQDHHMCKHWHCQNLGAATGNNSWHRHHNGAGAKILLETQVDTGTFFDTGLLLDTGFTMMPDNPPWILPQQAALRRVLQLLPRQAALAKPLLPAPRKTALPKMLRQERTMACSYLLPKVALAKAKKP